MVDGKTQYTFAEHLVSWDNFVDLRDYFENQVLNAPRRYCILDGFQIDHIVVDYLYDIYILFSIYYKL